MITEKYDENIMQLLSGSRAGTCEHVKQPLGSMEFRKTTSFSVATLLHEVVTMNNNSFGHGIAPANALDCMQNGLITRNKGSKLGYNAIQTAPTECLMTLKAGRSSCSF
jgi:hypothetical protein